MIWWWLLSMLIAFVLGFVFCDKVNDDLESGVVPDFKDGDVVYGVNADGERTEFVYSSKSDSLHEREKNGSLRAVIHR